MGEFTDVGTCAERFAPRAGHNDGTHPLVGRNISAGEQELVEGGKGGEIERRVVEGQHHDAAIAQTVVDEGALRHDQILFRAASAGNGLLRTVEIMASRQFSCPVPVSQVMTALQRRAMGTLLFALGIGAAQQGAGSKEVKASRNWVFVIRRYSARGADSRRSIYAVGQPAMRLRGPSTAAR